MRHNLNMAVLSPCHTFWVVVGLFLVVYNEFYEFTTVRHNQWTTSETTLPPSTQADGRDTVRILFVADPQIQGYQDEPALLGYVTRWDADRYLRTYFHHAMQFVKPDVVIFMGDLLDEGSKAENWEYEIYVNRLRNIFQVPDHIQRLYLAGDNDIGGEKSDHITPQKVARFEKYFSPVSESVQYRHVAFHKINTLPFVHRPPNAREDAAFRKTLNEMKLQTQEAKINIILSHTGMSEAMLHRHIQIMRILQPQYAFSAHSHYSSYMKHDLLQLVNFYKKVYPRDSAIEGLDKSEEMFMEEYRIPTCSYRMGVPNMAYAAAVIDADGQLHYTLLWLPSRYRQLYRYAIFVVFAGVAVFFRFMCRPNGRRRREYSYRQYEA